MYKIRADKRFVKVGGDSSIDPTVIIGEIPERPIKDLQLTIGTGAKIRSNSVIYSGSTIGSHLNTGHNIIIREESIIGDYVMIWSNSIVDYGCKIGNRVKIHSFVYVSQFTTIEDEVFLAPGVITGNDLHPGCPKSRECLKGPTIKKGAQIGLNATILPYVTIGEHAFIGAGSVVTRDIHSRKVAYGVPAKVICDVSEIKCIHQPPWVEKPYPY